jgi:hypothetical protein
MPQKADDQARVLISLSPEIQKLLADNEVQLIRMLNQEGVKAKQSEYPQSGPARQSGLKSPELIILVSAISIPLVASAIARIIDAIGRNRRAVVVARAWKPVLGQDGKPLTDSGGKTLMAWEETPTLLEPAQVKQEALSVETKFLGLEFHMTGEAPQK